MRSAPPPTLPPLALSTMWAQQQRFVGNFTAFVTIARDAGFAGVEVSHSTDDAGLREVATGGVLPVLSLHAPTPFEKTPRGKANSSLNLAACDEDDRAEAVSAHLRTIGLAAEYGVRRIVVHLGAVDGAFGGERDLRGHHAAGTLDGASAAASRLRAIEARAEAAPPHLVAARRSMTQLVAAARPHGIVIGLENRLHYHEIPSPEEAVSLLADYAPSEAGYWHDTGHAEVWARLGFVPHQRWFDLLRDRMIGCHLHDVRAILDHRAPTNGTLDWVMIAAGIPPTAARTCEIDQHEPDVLLRKAVAFLRELGLAAV